MLPVCMLLGILLAANDRNSTQISEGKIMFIGSLTGKDNRQVSRASGTAGSRRLSFSLLCFPLHWPRFVDSLNVWPGMVVALGFWGTLLCIPNLATSTHIPSHTFF